MNREKRARIMAWVGREIMPHEADVRAWLLRTLDPDDLEDVIQETYCQIAGLKDVSHIASGRAYFFTAARSIVLMRLRRARVVSMESVSEIENTGIAMDEPTPERVVAARRELERVQRLIEGLPDRCRRIFELRKVDGLSQREVAEQLGVTEFVIGNEVAKGMKLILQSIADGDRKTARAMARMGYDERTRNSTSDQ
ncbi:RNA polymerase sigma factor [Sphingopyxis sp. GW247-27LB]|uniref:RNA polymerase sigma factor n=1 Tax=Sphingopyxis sp. GW247-27LB TaxID=2012632 RepID=UPI001C3EE807|nr:sigma-70 family RNA polymerase sigma factor [Sphingopyxis sp. GW247-27LB]